MGEGIEGMALKKMEGWCGRNEKVWDGRALGSLFFFIVFLETRYWGNSNCIGGGFWRV